MENNDMKKSFGQKVAEGAKKVAKGVKKVIWDNKIGRCVTIAAGVIGAGFLAYKFIPAVNGTVNGWVAKKSNKGGESAPEDNKEEK